MSTLAQARRRSVESPGVARRRSCRRGAGRGLAICATAAVAALAAVSPGADAVGATRSSPAGVALIASVDRAYERVPAVRISVSGAGQVGRFTEILKGGSVAAEAYVVSNSSGTTILVAPTGSPTYAKEPHASCWRALARSAPQTLTDVGHPLLSFSGATIGAPRTTLGGWTVTVVAHGVTAVVAIDRSRLVTSVTATEAGLHAREQFTNLTRTPSLPNPAPRC